MLAGYQQQDAHEFYQFLVDRLHLSAEGHEAEPDKKCGCFFHKAFYGKIRSSVTCDRCGNVTVTEDPIMDLSLDVHVQGKKRLLGGRETGTSLSKPTTLSGCLESFTSPERLVTDQYNCGICGESAHRATKQLRIKKLPAILCMQLKVCITCSCTVFVLCLTVRLVSALNIRWLSRKRLKVGLTFLSRSICYPTRRRHTRRTSIRPNMCTTWHPRWCTKGNWRQDTTTLTAGRATR